MGVGRGGAAGGRAMNEAAFFFVADAFDEFERPMPYLCRVWLFCLFTWPKFRGVF